MAKKRVISIKNRINNNCIAVGTEDDQVQLFEGAWYFDPGVVDMTHLVVTDRTYICPYKGTCYWIDLQLPNHTIQDVSFTYFKVNPGYEFIKDKIAFYAGKREATMQDASVHGPATKIDN